MLRLLTLLLYFLPALALAQPVQQSGPVTPGHIAVWATNGVVQGGGPATNGKVTNLGLVGPGVPFCINDAPQGSIGGWHQFCLGANALGGGLLSYNALGGATALPLQCNINGVTSNCGATGGGGTPGGANTQLQFNNTGSFGGDSTFTFNTSTKVVGASSLNITTPATGLTFNSLPFINSPLDNNGNYTTIIGVSSGLSFNPTAVETTIVGYCAGGSSCNTGGGGPLSGAEDTFVGWHSGTQMSTGGFNTAVGVNTMGFETTGSGLVCVGTDCMRNTKGLVDTIGVGSGAVENGTQNFSVGLGFQALNGSSGFTGGSSNIAIGVAAMRCASCTSASNDVVIGANAAEVLTTGSGLIFIGSSTGASMTTQNSAVAIGASAMRYATGDFSVGVGTAALQGPSAGGFIGGSNVAIGTLAMACAACTTAGSDVAIGANAAEGLTSGSSLVLIGAGAGQNLTTSGDSVGIGAQAMQSGSGSFSVGVGINALQGNASFAGSNNVALGIDAMQCAACTSAGSDVVVGANAGGALTTGSGLVFVGPGAGSAATSATNSVGVGQNSLQSLTTGTAIVAVGVNAGLALTTASFTTLIGQGAGSGTNGSNDVVLGTNAMAAAGTQIGDTIIGSNAGHGVTGNSNTIVGQANGGGLVSGNGNVLLGAAGTTDVPSGAISNFLNINNVMLAWGINAGANAAFPNSLYQGNNLVVASTSTGASIDIPKAQLVTSISSISAAGTGAVPGAIVWGSTVPTGTYEILTTQVVSATVAAGGTGGTTGTQTVTGTTGTGTPFQASVTVAGGAITAVLSISVAGNYTANPTNIADEPVTGASLVGAALNVVMGALTAEVNPNGRGDVFTSCPGTIAATGGGSSGVVLVPACTAENTLTLMAGGGAVKFGSGAFTANGSVATTLTSLGPTGSHTTVQEWLTVTDASGTVRYIPAY